MNKQVKMQVTCFLPMINWFVKIKQFVSSQLITSLQMRSDLKMTELSQNELKVIRAHSLKKSLGNFRTTFKSRYLKRENANVTEVLDQLTSKNSDRGEEDYSRVL